MRKSLLRLGGMPETIADAPDREVVILCERDAVHATFSRYAPGRDGADVHIHRTHSDVFYVLEGELTLKRPEGDVTVPAGSFVRVPPMVAHGFANRGETTLKYLNFHVPGTGFADYMRGLRDGVNVPFDQEPAPDGHVSPGEPSVGDAVELDGVRIAVAETEPDGALLYAHGVAVTPR